MRDRRVHVQQRAGRSVGNLRLGSGGVFRNDLLDAGDIGLACLHAHIGPLPVEQGQPGGCQRAGGLVGLGGFDQEVDLDVVEESTHNRHRRVSASQLHGSANAACDVGRLREDVGKSRAVLSHPDRRNAVEHSAGLITLVLPRAIARGGHCNTGDGVGNGWGTAMDLRAQVEVEVQVDANLAEEACVDGDEPRFDSDLDGA